MEMYVQVHIVNARSQMGPSRLLVRLEHPDAVFLAHSDQTYRFGEGAALMLCIFMGRSWQPDDAIALIMLSGKCTPRFSIDPVRCGSKDPVQSSVRNPHKGSEHGSTLCSGFVALLVEECSRPNLEDHIVYLFIRSRMKFGTIRATLLTTAKLKSFRLGN
jgi:hypothetical protein